MYLHRGTQPRVQGVLIDTSTQGHTTLVIDTQSGVHNLEYRGFSLVHLHSPRVHTPRSTWGAQVKS